MNYKVRNFLNNLSKGFASFWGNCSKTIVSLLRMLVLSSPSVARHSKDYEKLKINSECCVLGNGPSLKNDLDSDRVDYKNKDVLCVNLFYLSPFFQIIKPRFYFLIDGIFFKPSNERQIQKVNSLIEGLNGVDWEMYLVVSSSAVSGSLLLKNLSNPHVKVIRMNSTEISGFRGFRHWAYHKRLGMPRCQTVLNFALGSAIAFGYDSIYLFGADHTWTRDLFVGDDNIVRYGDRHVYKQELTVAKKDYSFAWLLDAFSNMFKAHYLIEEYAKAVGVKIWNCSSDSFLDAYERLK